MNTKFNQLSKHLLMVLLTVVVASAQAQPPTHSNPLPPQGLLSRLIEIKYSSELYVETKLKSETSTAAQKDTALATYNTLRWKVDGFVYQLSSALVIQNSPKAFKQIDVWCYAQNNTKMNLASNKLIAQHVASFAEIDALYQTQITPKLYNQSKSLNLTTNVFYLLKDSYTIIKGLSDLKTRKTMAIVEILDHARLLGPVEVGKGVK